MTQLANLSTQLSMESASFLSAIEQSRGAVQRLIASLDPAAAATAKFNQQSTLLENAFKRGKISAEQYDTLLARLRARFDETGSAQGKLTQTSGQMRAGMQQLSFQIGDVAQGFAAGTPAMVIFAQQGGQVIQSISLMTAEAKGFLGFLGGPWMQIITAGVVVLSSLAGGHKGAAGAEKDHASAADELKAALDRLNASAADNNHTTRLGIQADIDAANAKRKLAIETYNASLARLQQAKVDEENSAFLARANEGGVTGQGMASQRVDELNALIKQQSDAIAKLDKAVAAGRSALIMRDVAAATDAATAATQKYEDTVDRLRRRFESGLMNGPLGDRRSAALQKEYQRLLTEAKVTFDAESAAAQKSEKAHRGRNSALSDGTRALREAAKEQREYLSTLTGLESKYLPAAAAARTYAKALAEIAALQALPASNPAHIDEVIAQQMREGAMREKLKVTNPGLFAPEKGTEGFLEADKRAEEARKRAQDILASQADQAEMQRLQISLLGKSDQYRQLEIARLEIIQRLRQAGIDAESEDGRLILANADAFERRQTELEKLQERAQEIREAMRGFGEDINRGLADAIVNGKSFGNVMHDALNRVLQDLIEIALKSAESALFGGGFGGGGGGGFGGLFQSIGSIFGGGGGTGSGKSVGSSLVAGDNWVEKTFGNTRLPGLAGGGSFDVGGVSGVDRNILAINGIPRVKVSASERVTITPAGAAGQSAPPIVMHNDFRGADAAAVSGINARLDRLQAELPARIVGTVSDAQTRGVLRR